MTERSCLLCSAERAAWEAAGIAVGCAEEATLLRAFDKAETLRAAQACGVAIPRTRLPGSEAECRAAAEEVGFPCVVKSRFSDALVGTRFLRSDGASYVRRVADLARAVRVHRQGPYWPIVQGFVGGRGKGVSGLCDRGRIVGLVAHERLRDVRPSGSGSSLRRSIRLDARLRAPAERLLAELEWHGPVMVELRDDGGQAPVLMEVNGRFWGSVQLAILAGLDVPRTWLAMLEHRAVPPSLEYREGVTLRWLWGDVKRFLNILQGPPPGFPGSYPSRRQGLRELFGTQPDGTLLETRHPEDPWPAVGEWVQGLTELVGHGWRSLTVRPRARLLEHSAQASPRQRYPAGAKSGSES
jgi:hypothetical protein